MNRNKNDLEKTKKNISSNNSEILDRNYTENLQK